MLVDQLQDRSEAVKFIEIDDSLSLTFSDQSVFVSMDGLQPVSESAFEALLNLLRIPIKYVDRLLETSEGMDLAIENLKYWIDQKRKFSLITEKGTVTQIFDGKRLYVPSILVNDLIVELIPHVDIANYTLEGDLFHAVYVSNDQTEVAPGIFMSQGIRALYSDCFNITPRFDGVLYEPETKTMLCWPVQNRKFRAASTTLSQVLDQVQDFTFLALDSMKENLIPAIGPAMDRTDLLNTADFIKRLCSDLRLNRKQQSELLSAITTPNMTAIQLIREIGAYTVSSVDIANISLMDAREIQVALSFYIVKGAFK